VLSSRTFEDADGGSKVVDSPSGLEGGGDDGGRGDEIVGEGVVQVALVLWLASVSFIVVRPTERGCHEGFAARVQARRRRTCSSKTSWTPSNSFSNLEATYG
jgi:hypothetical protein